MDNPTIDETGSYRYLLLVAVLIGAIAVLMGVAMSASAATLPAYIGTDMTVSGDEYYNDCTSELGANIIVASGGNLTLDTVTLEISAGHYIEVQSGGILYIVDSTLTYNTTTGMAWAIWLNNGGTLMIDNSTLEGYNDFSLYGNDATITDNTLTPSSNGIDGIDMWYDSLSFASDGPVITGNTITTSYNGLYMDCDYSTMQTTNFEDNIITSSWEGIYFRMYYADIDTFTISGNDMSNSNDDGVYLYANYATIYTLLEINDNVITNVNTYYGIYFTFQYGDLSSGAFDASGNDIQNVDIGMYIYDRYADWGSISIDYNTFNNLYNYFITINPYDTYYYGDIEFIGNSFSNQRSTYDTIRWYYSSGSTYAPEYYGTFTFNENSFSSTRAGMYFYQPYSTFDGALIHNNNTYNSVSGYGFYFYTYYHGDYDITINDNSWYSVSSYGFYYYQTSYEDMGYVNIINNDLDTVSSYGIYVYGYGAAWEDTLVKDNSWNSVSSYNLYLYYYYGSMGNMSIINNSLQSTSSYGMYLYGYYAPHKDVIFKDNWFYNINSYNIYWYYYYGSVGDLTVVNNSLQSSSSYGMYFYCYYATHGDVIFKDNFFSNVNGYNIYWYYYYGSAGNVSIINNTLQFSSSYGMYMYGYYAAHGEIIIEDNTFDGVNGYNIYYSFYYGSADNVSIARNSFNDNGGYAIYLYGYQAKNIQNFYCHNNTVTNARSTAFYFYDYYITASEIIIRDNDLSSSAGGSGYGIYGMFGYSAPKKVIFQNNVVRNFSSYGLYAYLYQASPTLFLVNNNTIVGNNYGLIVNNGYGSTQNFIVENNTLVSNTWMGMELDIYYMNGVPKISNNQVVNNQYGIYVYAYYASITGGYLSNNTMIKNDVGLYMDYNFDLRVEHNKIQSNNQRGIEVYGIDSGSNLEGEIHNNMITNNNVDIFLQEGITLRSYNNTFETASCNLGWSGLVPKLLVMGIMDVNVLWEDGSGPVGDAVLTIEDSQGNLLLDDRTDSGGWYRDIEIIIYTVDPDGTTYNTPFLINASKFGILSSNYIYAESETIVTILLDNVPPEIVIYTPEDKLVTNQLTLKVAGQTEAGAFIDINGDPVNVTQLGTFEYFIGLDKEGNNDIRIDARDKFNNTMTVLLHIVRDTVPPPLEVHTPKDGAATNEPSMMVEGETEPGATAKINEQIVPVDDIGRFSGTVLLAEGENTVTVVVIDEAGNEVMETMLVFLDSIPPTIDVLTPESGLITNLREIDVRGIASGAETVKVNGITMKLLGETFVSTYKLQPGTNTLLFEAWDEVNNYASYEVVVIQDNNPPSLEVYTPKDNMFTGNEVLVVSGSSELVNIVTVNAVQVTLDPSNGLFQYTVLLKEGTNRIVVKSVDPIGNVIEVVRNVFLDTTPPILTVTSPGDNVVTSNPKVIVEGIVEINSELTINGEAVPIEQGTFKKTMTLGEGENRIVIIATDKAGNKATILKEVYLDTEAGLQIFAPADGLRTTQGNITFTGRVESGSLLKINGVDIDLDNESRFAKQFPLDLGTNDFELVVTDANGNQVTTYRSVVREDVYVPPKKKDVAEGGTDLSTAILAVAVVALIVALLAIMMLFFMMQRYRRQEPPEYGGEGPVPADDMEKDEDLPPPQPPAARTRSVPPPVPPPTKDEEPSPFKAMDDGPKTMSDTAAEGEIGADETDLDTLKAKADALESAGADTTKAKQSLRMAQIYIEKNRKEKAEKHIQKAKQILTELDGSSEIEASGGEVEMRAPERPAPPPSQPEDRPKGIPTVPPPPGGRVDGTKKEGE